MSNRLARRWTWCAELLSQLGSKIAFYRQATRIVDDSTPAARLIGQLTGYTLLVPVRDEAAVGGAIDRLIARLNPFLNERLTFARRRQLLAGQWSLAAKKSPKPGEYTLDFVPSAPKLLETLRPTVVVRDGNLMAAASTDAAQKALANGPHWQAAGEFGPLCKRLPAQMNYLSIEDPREWTTLFLDMLPVAIQQINWEIMLAQRQSGIQPDGSRMRLEPDMIPTAESLNRLLFPALTSVVMDRDGARLVQRGAILSPTSLLSAGIMAAFCWPAVESAIDVKRREGSAPAT